MHHVQRLKGKKVAIIIDFSFEDMEVIIMHNAGRWGLNGPRAGQAPVALPLRRRRIRRHGPFFSRRFSWTPARPTAVQAMYPKMRQPCR